MALALAGFTIGMVEQYRKLADEAFERVLALSASCAFVYSFGCVPVAYGGDAARDRLGRARDPPEANNPFCNASG